MSKIVSKVMKDSGIEWLGMVPEHWDVKRVKGMFTSPKVKTQPNRKDVLSLTLNGVIEKDISKNEGLNPESYDTYQSVETDDLVFKLIDLENYQTSRVGKVWKNGIMSSAYIRLAKTQNTCVDYFYYQFFDLYKRAIFNKLGNEGVRSNLSHRDLLRLKVLNPPILEQQAIATYLDTKTAPIDALINQKKKLITELEAYKSALISEVVTKGLDPNVPMKDSGIERLGDVPKHWGVVRLKYVVNHKTIKSNESNFKIALENIESRTTKYLETQDSIFSEMGINFSRGDILFSKLRPYLAKVYLAEKDGICVSEFAVMEPKKVENVFFKYMLLSNHFIEYVNSSTYGTKMPRASWDFIGNSFIPLPPLPEQQAIATYLDAKTTQINHLITQNQSQIQELESYKSSLISEVVTGKKSI